LFVEVYFSETLVRRGGGEGGGGALGAGTGRGVSGAREGGSKVPVSIKQTMHESAARGKRKVLINLCKRTI
jgi:hypothetical protein